MLRTAEVNAEKVNHCGAAVYYTDSSKEFALIYHTRLKITQTMGDRNRTLNSLVEEYGQLDETWPAKVAEVSVSAFEHVCNVLEGMVMTAFFAGTCWKSEGPNEW